MKRRGFLPILALAIVAAAGCFAASPPERWAVYYTDALPAEAFRSFDVIVFDSDSHPPLAPLKAKHKMLLGYISLGEAEDYRSYYHALEEKNLLLAPNPQWPGHRAVDARRSEWTAYAADVLIPALLAQGFDGIMMDTIDSLTQLEADDPKHYSGMKQAAARMIKTIRARYPHIKIMLNRGFDILPQVAGDIDMVMAESVYSNWVAGEKKATILPADDRRYYVDLLKHAQRQSPALKIYTIDYWPPEDREGVKRIYAAERAEGFIPYVATPALQTLHTEPQ